MSNDIQEHHIVIQDNLSHFLNIFTDPSRVVSLESGFIQHLECAIRMYRDEKDPNKLLEYSDGSKYKTSEVIHILEKELILRKL